MSSSKNQKRQNLLRKALTGAALATGGAVMLAGGAQAQAGEGGVPDGFEAAKGLPNVDSVRTLADGSVEVTLTDGRILTFQAAEIAVVDGEVYIAQTAIEGADFSVAAAGGGGGGGAGIALGVLGGGALLGAAAGGGGGGGGSSPTPTPTPTPNNPPSFTSATDASVSENTTGAVYTATATDPDGNTVTFSISGGADASLFSINSSTGALSFNSAPDFESPADANGDNVYEVTIQASDGSASVTQTVTITVTDEDEAPEFSSGGSASVTENSTGVVYTAAAADPEGEAVSYSLSGADAALFTIDADTGEVRFAAAPDHENPQDSNGDNVYDITVTASDGTISSSQSISVSVENVNDTAPNFVTTDVVYVGEGVMGTVMTVTASDGDGDPVSYAIVGGADSSDFSINAATGEIEFNFIPDFEDPQDADADNVYEFTVRASDGSFTTDQTISVIVTDESEVGAPGFLSGTSSTVAELQTSAYVASATDPQGDAVNYFLSGTDAARFTIDNVTGEVRFNTAPDFESPADADGNNIYDITVTASDGSNSTSQDVSITVSDVTEGADVPDNNSTQIHMVSGGSYVGQLETSGDEDWVRVELTAGQRYQFDLSGTGSEPVEDTFIRLYDASGNLIAENDDISTGVVRDSRLGFTATESGTYYIEVDSWDGGSVDERTGEYTLEISHTDPLRNWSYQEIADYLRSGFGGARFNASSGDTLTVNITGLTAAGQTLARAALEVWSDVTGLNFSEITGSAQITFDDEEDGAFAGPDDVSGGFITASSVNVGTEWIDTYGTTLDTYSFQTYIHEIGHALGLGHAGPYDGSASYGIDNIYLNDSWQATVMSYFSQNENTEVDASVAFVAGLQVADIIAARDMYGLSTTTRVGDTTYGFNSNAGTIYNANNGFSNAITFTVYDAGGTDTFDYSGYNGRQRLDLREEAYSNVNGLTGNVGIANGTVIENAIGGGDDDYLIGNGADNVLTGNGGDDSFIASGGNDTFIGGSGTDRAIFSGSAGNYSVTTNGAGNTVVTDNRAGSPDGTVELIGVETIQYDGLLTHADFFGPAGSQETGVQFDMSGLPWTGEGTPVMASLSDRVLLDFALSPDPAAKLDTKWDGAQVMDRLSDADHTDLNAGWGKYEDPHLYPHLDPADRAEIGAWADEAAGGMAFGFSLLPQLLDRIDISAIARNLVEDGYRDPGEGAQMPRPGAPAGPDAGVADNLLPVFTALSDDAASLTSDDVWL